MITARNIKELDCQNYNFYLQDWQINLNNDLSLPGIILSPPGVFGGCEEFAGTLLGEEE